MTEINQQNWIDILSLVLFWRAKQITQVEKELNYDSCPAAMGNQIWKYFLQSDSPNILKQKTTSKTEEQILKQPLVK